MRRCQGLGRGVTGAINTAQLLPDRAVDNASTLRFDYIDLALLHQKGLLRIPFQHTTSRVQSIATVPGYESMPAVHL